MTLAQQIEALEVQGKLYLNGFFEEQMNFSNACKEIEDFTFQLAATPEQKEKLRLKEIEEKRNKIYAADNLYSESRNNAIAFFKNENYTGALRNIKQALHIFSEDPELS